MVSATLPPTISPTSSVASSTATPAADTSSGGISSAAIGGIAAMAVIVVIGAGAFFMLRRKRQRNQTQKRNTTMSVDPFTMGFGSNNPPPPAHYQQQPMQSHAMTDTSFAQPPPMLSQPVPVPMPPAAPVEAESQPLGTYTVISTYTPTLGDELEIQPGDRVEILVEYDDGWVTGRNVSKGGVKGVFPKHCIDYATSPSQHQPAMLDAAGDETGRTKRISSIYGAQ
ncbi:hypothetical protein K450DRAFT_241510 [Umbelopsis ramanniana AG]|uniref:SH3 domain-containing protein n=1 Tax=Umbelopsis ramanniana AG TaxID=1314678 RepID=A0AAD5EA67_UMBRA|nr:uncharacterized protein K450DRAFT_241510 [Umbelopsis ramanniana AG]KAI8579552.1 hypothetical protein K450DRAFT_241510 [Umbelopsis ramanniana AG]